MRRSGIVGRIIFITLVMLSLDQYRTRADDPPPTPHYERYQELSIKLPDTGTYKNPYDPAQADVQVTFDAPDGQSISVPGFWMQPYRQTCTQNCVSETLQADGQPGWWVRFAPTLPGEWKYKATIQDAGGQRDMAQGEFSVADSTRPGSIRVARNRRYFTHDDGTPYFPVGSNLGWSWSGGGGTLTYLRWLGELHHVGANYARLYIDAPWFIALEAKAPVGDYGAAQQDAWRLDTILQAAEEQGIALQLVIQRGQALAPFSGPPVNIPTTPNRPDTHADWNSNPYNLAIGGPLNGAAQFFASDAARALFHRRLRYITARWGYSTSVFAWEIIDQLDRPPAFSPASASDWLKDVVTYLRQIDPAHHLVTAGVRDTTKIALLDSVLLDIRQTRYYQRRPVETAVDQVTGALTLLNPLLSSAERPVLMSEFSLNPWFEPAADDPTGVHIRETMWATALSGAGGSAASDWWDTYLFPQNLTSIFGPLAAFSKGIPWNSADLQPISVGLMSDSTSGYQPIKITGFNGAPNAPRDPTDTVYRLTTEGLLPPPATITSYLYGSVYSSQLKRAQKYLIAPPIDTTLTVNVKRVSERAAARLTITIDGKLAAQLTIKPQSPLASLTVPLSAGEHTVILDNLGDDFLQLDSIEIAAYLAPLRAVALADRKMGIFAAWLQHRDYTWENVARKVEPKPLNFQLRIGGMPPGVYRVELWDPFSGNVVGDEMLTVSGSEPGALTITLLPITQMLAVRAFRVNEAGATPTP